MKKLTFTSRLGLLTTALFLVGGFFVTNLEAAITSTFTASVPPVIENVSASTIPAINFTGGADFVNATIPAVTFAGGVDQTKASDDSTDTDGSTVTADVFGASSNGITITITDDESTDCASVTLGGVTPAYTIACDLDNSLTTGTVLTATALTALIDGAFDLTAVVKGTGGNTITADTITLTGGVDAVAAFDIITIPAGLVASAADHSVTIDGIVIDLGTSALTDVQVAAAIDAVDFSAKDYDVTSSGADLIFTKDTSGSAGNSGLLTIEDAVYNSAGPTAASATITIPAGLVADATDHLVTIDGIVIDLGVLVLTADEVAAKIALDPFTGKDYTVTNPSGADLTFTKNATGPAGNVSLTIEDNSYGARAQEVTFTPASVTAGETFRVAINGSLPVVPATGPYYYTALPGDDVPQVTAALKSLVDADGAVACTEDTFIITCTSETAGTPFTYDADVVDITPPLISNLSFTPDAVTAKIGDVITLNITADQVGYTAGAITVNGVAIDALSFTDNGGGAYSATYTVVEGHTDRVAGTVPVSVVLTDNNGNSNTAFTTISSTLAIDAHAPTLLSAETTSTTTIEATFSEDINGSTVNGSGSEFAVTGGHPVSGASESSGIVTLTLSSAMTTNETPDVTFTNIDNFRDLAGNQAISPATVTSADGVAPVLAEVTPVPTPDNDSTPDYTFSSTEGDTINYGGDCSGTPPSSAVVGSNLVTFDTLPDGVHSNCTITVTDSNTNVSLPLAVSSFTIDTVPPSVVISSLAPDPTNTSPVPFTATFSENVTGFSGADIDLVNGIISSFVPVSGSVYNFGVVPVVQGLMTVDVDANSGIDAAGNNNTAAAQFDITYDSVSPVITMLGTSSVNIEYGETYTDDGATALDSNDGDITGSIVTTNPVNTNVLGTYTVRYNVADAAGNNATEVTRTVNVIQRAITVTAVTDTKEYDNTNSSSGVPVITSGSLAGGDSVTWIQTYDNKNVGTSKVLTPAGTVSDGNGGNNYAVTFVNDPTGEITAKDVTVTADSQSKTYGDPDPVLTHDGVLLGTDTFSGSLTRDVGEDVGTYAINQGTLDAGSNYNIIFVSDDLTINQKDITVTADAQSKTYGDADPALTYTNDPLVGIDTFSGSLNRASGEDVGTYAIDQGTLDAGANYNINFVSDDLTISQKDITVSADPQSKIYGAADPALTYTNDPLVLGDSFSGGLDRASGENVGTYAIDQGTLDAGSNYNITFVSDDLTITPLAITGEFTADDKVYDGNTPANISGRSLSGVLGVDDVSYTGGAATFSDKNVGTGKTVSGTGFSLSGADAGNYTVNSSAVTTADITAKALTITAVGEDKFYDGNTEAQIILSDDRVSGDVLSINYVSANFNDEQVGSSKPISVVGISISGVDALNYTQNTTANTTASILNRPAESGGGSSGGGNSRRVTPPVTPPAPASGEVLGAEQFVFTLFLKQGVIAGAEVMELQKFLNTAGFGPLVVDGKFGPLTKAAVIKFQLANGLKGDGIVGPLTRAVLNKPKQ